MDTGYDARISYLEIICGKQKPWYYRYQQIPKCGEGKQRQEPEYWVVFAGRQFCDYCQETQVLGSVICLVVFHSL